MILHSPLEQDKIYKNCLSHWLSDRDDSAIKFRELEYIGRARIFNRNLFVASKPSPFHDFHYILIFKVHNILTLCRYKWIWCLF